MNVPEIKNIYCEICQNECHNNYSSPECNHTFCNNCTKEYFLYKLSNSLNNNKIKCLLSRCNSFYSEEDSKNIIEKDRNLRNLYYWNNIESIPNSIPCPIPNCNSYSNLNESNQKNLDKNIINDETSNINNNVNTSIREINLKIIEEEPVILICKNNHKFCSKCLELEHKNKKCNEVNKTFTPIYIYQTQEEINRNIYKKDRGCTGGRKCNYILNGCCMENCCDKCSELIYFRDMYECCESKHSFINVLIKIFIFPLAFGLITFLTVILCTFPNSLILPFITSYFGKKIRSKYSVLIYGFTIFLITETLITYSILVLFLFIIIYIIGGRCVIDDFPFCFLYCHLVLIILGGDGLIEGDD